MKVIISTKAYPQFIDRAIRKGFENFVIDGQNKEIQFYKLGKNQPNDMHPIIGDETEVFRAKFNELQWYKLSEFLKQLPEQPIVLEFNYEDDVTIKATQFVATF